MRSTLKKPPPCEPRSYTQYPGLNPDGPACHKRQIGSPWAIHLHVLQLPKDRVTLQYVHYHSHVPGECGRKGPTRVVSHRHLQHHGVFLHWGLIDPFPNICQCIGQPLHQKSWGAIQWRVFPLFIWGIHLSRVLTPLRVHPRHTTAMASNL